MGVGFLCFGWDLGLMVETLGQGSGFDIFGFFAKLFCRFIDIEPQGVRIARGAATNSTVDFP